MGQIDLNNYTCTSPITSTGKRAYTKKYVENKCKIWHKSNQMGLDGWPFFTFNDIIEVEWVKAAILDALNNPKKFNATDTYGALCNLKQKIKGKNAIVLKSKYGVPPKMEYRNKETINSIVDANRNDEIIIPLTAEEILDIIVDLNKGRKLDEIYHAYEFHHDEMSIEYLERFKDLYNHGELNKLIRFICSKSNELGGFYDYGVNVIRNRLTSHYIFDSRREVDAK